jgi:small-conductance mechanosensitive channel
MELKQIFFDAMSALWTKLAAFIPNLIAGVVIVVIGYFVAKLLGRIVKTVAHKLGIDKTGENVGVQDVLQASGIASPSDLIGKTIFWLAMLVFVITAAESVGLSTVSGTIDTFVMFLPKVVAAVVIALLGLFFAQVFRDFVARTTSGLGVEYAKALGGLVYAVVIFVVITLAIAQLEIDTGLLHLIIGITLAVVGLATAVSLGLGTRDVAKHIVNGVYARDSFKPGKLISCDGYAGKLIEVGSVSTVIETKDGKRIHVPNTVLMDRVVETADA